MGIAVGISRPPSSKSTACTCGRQSRKKIQRQRRKTQLKFKVTNGITETRNKEKRNGYGDLKSVAMLWQITKCSQSLCSKSYHGIQIPLRGIKRMSLNNVLDFLISSITENCFKQKQKKYRQLGNLQNE